MLNYVRIHILSKLLLIAVILSRSVLLFGQFAGGNGTANNPYLIANVTQLQAIRNAPNSAHFKLINDIDATATSTWNSGQGFNPIGWLGGTIDGNGFTISNLVINRQGFYQAAFITQLGSDGVVENLNFSNTSIIGGNRSAVVAGTLAGTISNVVITGNVTGQSNVGGIAGQVDGGGIISNAQFSGNINGTNDFVGGLTGLLNSNAFILNSSMHGTVNGQARVGGIAGQMNSNSLIENSIANINVTGQNDFTGGITGYNNQGSILNSSSTGKVSGVKFVGGLVGRNDGTISLSNSSADVTASNDEVGGLIGRNHNGIIYDSFSSGLVTGSNSVGGLIGWNGYGGSIINNSNSSSHAIGNENVGGLIGYIHSGTIEESYSTGTATGRTNVGGLVGSSQSGTIIRISFSSANVIPTSGGGNRNQFGGLVGYANQTTIENCFANGSVDGNNRVGGLIGEISGGSVTNSYSSGMINPGAGQSGGLIGRLSGSSSITNSFWDVEASGMPNSAGGTPKTTSQMLDINTYLQANWNLTDVWAIDADLNGGYPFLIPLAGAFMIVWTGEVSIEWSNPGNWNIFTVPRQGDNVRIPNVGNKPLISDNIVIKGLNIQPNSSITISNNGTLTVTGSVNNLAGVSGIIVLSNELGTGSFIHTTQSVQGTFMRYISGEPEAWHMLSSPMANQAISPEFTPSGTYGDDTGYDFYAWYEPDTSWVYFLNNQYPPTWLTVNGNNSFQSGRGYLVSYQEANPIKTFSGILNNGEILIDVTKSSGLAGEFGSNLIGNPYPSSIDWKSTNGWDRSALENSGGGYDLWIWNDAANNYGVYNSSSGSDFGTLGVTRYIAPTQGFFVKAAQSGSISMNNDCRVHDGAGNWIKNFSTEIRRISITVSPDHSHCSDEVVLEFGHTKNAGGTIKKFSFIPTAPSLYIPYNSKNYSLKIYDVEHEKPVIPISFKVGTNGTYTLAISSENHGFEILVLEDLHTGYKHNLLEDQFYVFQANTIDNPNRFVIHLKEGTFANPHDEFPVRVYSYNRTVYADLQLLDIGSNCLLEVIDLSGRAVFKREIPSGQITGTQLNLLQGIYIVRITGKPGRVVHKIIF